MSTSSTKKMQWFIDNYNQNHLNYILWNTGMSYGTVVMPTGTGKSGVVYEDIVRTIDELAKDKKLIINKTDYILLLNIIGFYLHQKHILKNDIKESAIKKIISNNTCTDIDIANAKKVRSNVRHLMKDYIDKLSKQICYALNQKQYQEFVLDKENNWEK